MFTPLDYVNESIKELYAENAALKQRISNLENFILDSINATKLANYVLTKK